MKVFHNHSLNPVKSNDHPLTTERAPRDLGFLFPSLDSQPSEKTQEESELLEDGKSADGTVSIHSDPGRTLEVPASGG